MFDKNTITRYFLKGGFSFFILLIIFFAGFFVFRVKSDTDLYLADIYENIQNRSNDINCHPLVKSSDDFHGERTNFSFSLDKKYIAFVQNVFDEYGRDWDRYWALKILDTESNEEKNLFVGDYKFSHYDWLNNDSIRIFRGAGTGVRVYFDIFIIGRQTIFSKDFKRGEGWLFDEEYAKEIKSIEKAQQVYYEFQESR